MPLSVLAPFASLAPPLPPTDELAVRPQPDLRDRDGALEGAHVPGSFLVSLAVGAQIGNATALREPQELGHAQVQSDPSDAGRAVKPA
jgi:hypothetical protein